MIDRAKRIIKGAVRRIQKKAGLRIYRKVSNAQKWADWLVASGVPGAKTAEELEITVITALGDVQVIPDQKSYVVPSTSGVFCVIGGKLCFAWYDYGYYDRHWALREIADCEVCHFSRAILVLSDEAGDFDFTDDQLHNAPASLVLDGESTASIQDDEIQVMKSAPFTPTAAMAEKAKSLLLASFDDHDADPMQQAALDDLSRGKPVRKAQILEDLGPETAGDIGIDESGAPEPKKNREPQGDPAPVVQEETKEKTVDVKKGREVQVLKRDAERQIIYGWGSVSTVDGELYTDLHGDTISVEALHDIATEIVKGGANLGGVEHGETPNKLTAAVVIDDSWAAAMSDNFFFDEAGVLKTKKQGLFIGYHVEDKQAWDDAKDQPMEFSINATAFIADKD